MFKTNSLEAVGQLALCLENPSYEIKGKIKDIRTLLNTEFWPSAVPEGLIVKNEEQAKLRARSILYSYDIIDVSAEISKQSMLTKPQTKLLDYGCGDGSTVMAAKEMGVEAYGYDINHKWKNDNPSLTTDFELIKNNAPYSHILIYDVIDHTSYDQALALLNNIKELSDSTTKIAVRVHPWLSRHGAHTYYKLNKAYAHLFVLDEELHQLTDEKVEKIVRPMKYYSDLFANARLNAVTTNPIKRPLEQFFKDPQIMEHLQKITVGTDDNTHLRSVKWIEEVLSIEFIDYQLSK